MTSPTLNYIGIVARDLTASLAFYRSLSLAVPEPQGGHTQVELPGGMTLAWDAVADIASMVDWVPPTGSSRMALAFQCVSPSHVDEMYGSLVAAGHPGHLEPFDAPWGQRYASVEDPDGNTVDLYAPQPPGE